MAIYSGFPHPLKMVIFHSYVSLPEGNWDDPVSRLLSQEDVGSISPFQTNYH